MQLNIRNQNVKSCHIFILDGSGIYPETNAVLIFSFEEMN